MNSYIILQDGVSMLLGMKPHNIDRSHPNYTKIVDALKANDYAAVEDLVNIAKSLVKFCGDKLTVDVDAGVVNYAGDEIHGSLASRLLAMMAEGFDVSPLVNFLENLQSNPSKRAVDELYGFLEFGKMPITPDGHFLAYKRVRTDYKSVHDGKTDNSIGSTPEMPRNKVDDNAERTCSHGLHFCSHGYLGSFSGEKVVVLKVNPRDVVSIPVDYNNTKGRACRYEVVGELSPEEVSKALGGGFFEMSVNGDYEDRDSDFDDEGESFDRHGGDGYGEDAEEMSQAYIDGYNDGYTDGRKREGVEYDLPYLSDFEQGYNRGWKDGKGHKSKLVFVPTDDSTY